MKPFQDLYTLDLHKKEWSSFKDAGARPAPTSFHCAVQYKQFMLTYGGRFNDNSHSNQLNVLGKLFIQVFLSVWVVGDVIVRVYFYFYVKTK